MPTNRAIVVGVDPASTTGLVALSVDRERMGYEDAWRWIESKHVSKSSRKAATGAENALALFIQVRSFLYNVMNQHQQDVVHVAIERPADMAGKFMEVRGGQKQRGQRTGTAFAIGEAYGMCASAACDAKTRVFDYAVTPGKDRVGWMPRERSGHLEHVMKRERLLDYLAARSRALRTRPLRGIVEAAAYDRLDDNELMALGVLLFHLSRQVR